MRLVEALEQARVSLRDIELSDVIEFYDTESYRDGLLVPEKRQGIIGNISGSIAEQLVYQWLIRCPYIKIDRIKTVQEPNYIMRGRRNRITAHRQRGLYQKPVEFLFPKTTDSKY